MSWQEQDRMKLRKEFVLQVMNKEIPMAEVCRRYHVSRKTGYKWLNRYRAAGDHALLDQSKQPHSSPRKLPDCLVDQIMTVRKKHPRWGARKVQAVLNREGIVTPPAPSTIHKILQKKGCLSANKPSTAHLHRFEHAAPNHLWQMDFKGHFAYEKGRCHPLTILDDHSRFSVRLQACSNETGETVKPLLIDTFRRYGLPERINVDNGNPWGSLFACARYTTLSIWLIRLGITVSYSRPRHPQTNGKEERFHRTLKEELLSAHYFRDLLHIQKCFDEWRDSYNLERPHEAIGMQVPAERYRPSYRAYPEQLPAIGYSDDYLIRRVDNRGRLSMEGRQLFVGVPFAKEQLGIRHSTQANTIQIYYAHQKLGEIDLSLLPKNTSINLYSKRVTDL